MKLIRFSVVWSFVVLMCSDTSAQPSFVTVGDLPGGNTISYAIYISSDGSVVSGFSLSSQGESAFRWTASTGILALPRDLGPGQYNGGVISPNGDVISGLYNGLGSVWSEALGTRSIGDLPGGIQASYVSDVSNQSLAVGASSFGLNTFGAPLYRAVRWSPDSGLEPLPLPTASDEQGNSSANVILDDGRIFGNSDSGAWFYSESNGFEMLPGADYLSNSNPDGTFLLGSISNPDRGATSAAYWTRDEGLQYLPIAGTNDPSFAFGMSDDGSVIVGRDSTRQVVWIDQGEPILISDYAESIGLDMSEWVITSVLGVSGDGTTIVGSARHLDWAGGHIEGFVLTTPKPCPADVNGDGELTPSDFTAWIGAFQNSLSACDQNGDGVCAPGDFAAWIANYNAGC